MKKTYKTGGHAINAKIMIHFSLHRPYLIVSEVAKVCCIPLLLCWEEYAYFLESLDDKQTIIIISLHSKSLFLSVLFIYS